MGKSIMGRFYIPYSQRGHEPKILPDGGLDTPFSIDALLELPNARW